MIYSCMIITDIGICMVIGMGHLTIVYLMENHHIYDLLLEYICISKMYSPENIFQKRISLKNPCSIYFRMIRHVYFG